MTGLASGLDKNIRLGVLARDGVVRPVAGPAIGDFRMSLFQSHINFTMIEIGGIPNDEDCFFSTMFRVAHHTVFAEIPVVAALIGNTLGNFLMAGHTQLRDHFEVFVVALHTA